MSEALDRPADCSLAHPNCANSIEELAPLAVSSPGPSFDVFLKQQHGTLIQLRRLAQPPLWGKRAALVEPLKVTVDRRAVDPEPTGGLAFGNVLLYGLYYPGAQIYGVGLHLPMMLGDATSVQAAVGLVSALVIYAFGSAEVDIYANCLYIEGALLPGLRQTVHC